MSRRLLKVSGSRGLYKYDGADGFGNRLVWEPLPPVTIDPEIRLQAEAASAGPKLDLPGGLYADTEQQRRAATRRKANQVLEDAGLRPRSRW
jgi:hypothetical protein